MKKDNRHIASELIEKMRLHDDENAFEELFNLFYERLLNFSIQYLDDRQSAEEVVSDVFTKFWLRRKEFTDIKNPETYLFIAVKNQSLNYLKYFSRLKVAYLEETGTHELINSHCPEKELELKELRFRMTQAINSLPQQCRIVFNLIKEEGLKYKEVSEILNISPRTVETQLVRALKKLDKVVTSYLHPHTEKDSLIGKNILSIFFFLTFFL